MLPSVTGNSFLEGGGVKEIHILFLDGIVSTISRISIKLSTVVKQFIFRSTFKITQMIRTSEKFILLVRTKTKFWFVFTI